MESTQADLAGEIRRTVEQPFGLFTDLFQLQARARPDTTALICGCETITYRQLAAFSGRIAAGLQREGAARGTIVAICGASSIAYVATFIGVLLTGAAVLAAVPLLELRPACHHAGR